MSSFFDLILRIESSIIIRILFRSSAGFIRVLKSKEETIMECKIKNDLGTIYIAEDVMMKVVGYAALECYGIVAMSGKKATDGIVE